MTVGSNWAASGTMSGEEVEGENKLILFFSYYKKEALFHCQG